MGGDSDDQLDAGAAGERDAVEVAPPEEQCGPTPALLVSADSFTLPGTDTSVLPLKVRLVSLAANASDLYYSVSVGEDPAALAVADGAGSLLGLRSPAVSAGEPPAAQGAPDEDAEAEGARRGDELPLAVAVGEGPLELDRREGLEAPDVRGRLDRLQRGEGAADLDRYADPTVDNLEIAKLWASRPPATPSWSPAASGRSAGRWSRS